MDLRELRTIIGRLRVEGGDVADIEAKTAADGFPKTVISTLSAFANTPGGGLLIFGVDERSGFTATGVYDVALCKSALATVARQNLIPPITFEVQDFEFEGARVVVAQVHEIPSSAKPCRVRSTGKAYLRAYDGDYELSQIEEQAFLASRDTPRFDQATISGATRDDLDPELLISYIVSSRAGSTSLARLSDDDILFRTGVTAGPDRTPTVAGLLALGVYPQQFMPNAIIQASVTTGKAGTAGIRALDVQRFDGPIPLMLEQALNWVQRNSQTRIRQSAQGHTHDEREYPPEAVRELLSNALVHRDLGPYALTQAITLRLEPGQLILTNPGGLWGVTVDNLGRTGVTSSRNAWLLRICQNVRFGPERRVVEALASGIPTILTSLQAAQMPPPHFHDQAIRFTARLVNSALPEKKGKSKKSRSVNAALLMEALERKAATMNQLMAETGLSERQIQYALKPLRADGLVRVHGGRGSHTVYRLAGSDDET
ncbi:ATP-dependent DNA helicase RecG [Streptosporangium subroseum]|uniref:ATP-dependent DNA helicase RecG n=1 Tax=Streptosporangium subroseum TaxID=106412 RepID=A0A239JDQ1_9ACTN|nr:RNA-binding domain-containing protein [Streptosporangium subroseum]SNT04031.1 ATP-dependent DNA helicase RecG [Streptosporangium subroseum]